MEPSLCSYYRRVPQVGEQVLKIFLGKLEGRLRDMYTYSEAARSCYWQMMWFSYSTWNFFRGVLLFLFLVRILTLLTSPLLIFYWHGILLSIAEVLRSLARTYTATAPVFTETIVSIFQILSRHYSDTYWMMCWISAVFFKLSSHNIPLLTLKTSSPFPDKNVNRCNL